MAHSWIKYVIGIALMITIFACQRFDYKEGFIINIGHSSGFYKGNPVKGKFGWGKVYPIKKTMDITYQPKKELFIFDRPSGIDTLHKMKLSEAEQHQVTKTYGDFKFVGAFEDYNLPPEFSHYFYVNPSTLEILQIDRLINDAKGKILLTGGLLYMKDSVNYLISNRLFAQPGE